MTTLLLCAEKATKEDFWMFVGKFAFITIGLIFFNVEEYFSETPKGKRTLKDACIAALKPLEPGDI